MLAVPQLYHNLIHHQFISSFSFYFTRFKHHTSKYKEVEKIKIHFNHMAKIYPPERAKLTSSSVVLLLLAVHSIGSLSLDFAQRRHTMRTMIIKKLNLIRLRCNLAIYFSLNSATCFFASLWGVKTYLAWWGEREKERNICIHTHIDRAKCSTFSTCRSRRWFFFSPLATLNIQTR